MDESAEQEDLKQALERNRLHIVEMLQPEGLILDSLRSKSILSEEDNDLIKNKTLNRTRREQVGCFLDIICKKGSNGMLSFIEALEYTNRELYKKITGKEPKELNRYQKLNRDSDPKFLEYVNHLTTKFVVVSKQLRDIRDDRDELSLQIKSLEEDKKLLIKEKDDWKARLITCENIMKKKLFAQVELSKLQEQHIILHKTLQECMKENSENQRKCYQLYLQKDKLDQLLQESQCESDKLRDSLKNIRENFTREQNLSMQLRKQIEKIPSAAEFESLKKEKDNLSREMRILKSGSIVLNETKIQTSDNTLKMCIEALEDQKSQLQAECEQLANELYEMRRTLDETEREKDEYRNIQEQLKVENNILDENCSVYKERRDALLNQLQQIKEERDDAIKERNKAQQEVEEKIIGRDQLIIDKQVIEEECLQYKQQVQILNGQLAQAIKKLEKYTEITFKPTPLMSKHTFEFPLQTENEALNSKHLRKNEDKCKFRVRSNNVKFYPKLSGWRTKSKPVADIVFRKPERSSSISVQASLSEKKTVDVEEVKRISHLSLSWDNLDMIDQNPDLIRYLPTINISDESQSVPLHSPSDHKSESNVREIALKTADIAKIQLTGGNVTGIFCKISLNELNLQEGNQFIAMKYTSDKEKEISFVGCTLDFASRKLKEGIEESKSDIYFTLSNCQAYENLKTWLQMDKMSGDDFFIRSRITLEYEKEKNCMNMGVGDIFQVINTIYDENHWYARLMNDTKFSSPVEGKIPNYERAKNILINTSIKKQRVTVDKGKPEKINSFVFSNFFLNKPKRKHGIKTKMVNKTFPREIELKMFTEAQLKLSTQPYVIVKPQQCSVKRPIIIYGPDDVTEDLKQNLLNLTTKPTIKLCPKIELSASIPELCNDVNILYFERLNNTISGARIEEVERLSKKAIHCLLDISPSKIQNLCIHGFNPIIFLLRSMSQKSVSLPRNINEAKSTYKETCIKVAEVEQILESYMYENIELIPGKDLKSIAVDIQNIVEERQNQIIWLECDEYSM